MAQIDGFRPFIIGIRVRQSQPDRYGSGSPSNPTPAGVPDSGTEVPGTPAWAQPVPVEALQFDSREIHYLYYNYNG